jgi:hypothetical protein
MIENVKDYIAHHNIQVTNRKHNYYRNYTKRSQKYPNVLIHN